MLDDDVAVASGGLRWVGSVLQREPGRILVEVMTGEPGRWYESSPRIAAVLWLHAPRGGVDWESLTVASPELAWDHSALAVAAARAVVEVDALARRWWATLAEGE